MKEKNNEATINRPGGSRSIDAPVLLIDLPFYINQVKTEIAWQKNDRNSITVFKTDKIRMVLVAMHKGAEMHTTRPDNILTLQVIDGMMRLSTNQKTIEASKEQILTLHEHIAYSLQAVEESIFLLTIAE